MSVAAISLLALHIQHTGSYMVYLMPKPAWACAHVMFPVGQAGHALTRQKHCQLGTSAAGAIQHAVQHLPGSVATQSRFPRPRTDLKKMLSHSPPSVHSAGTSMLANAGNSLFNFAMATCVYMTPNTSTLKPVNYLLQRSSWCFLQAPRHLSSQSQQTPSTSGLKECPTQQELARAADLQCRPQKLVSLHAGIGMRGLVKECSMLQTAGCML